MAELSTKKRNNLSDGAFAYVDGDGGRHLPIGDAAHVRNAIARFSSTKFESDAKKKSAAAAIRAAAKKYDIDVSEDSAINMAEDAGVKHTHAKVGGGQETHDDHPATKGHKHDGMLPFFAKPGGTVKASEGPREPRVISLLFDRPLNLAEETIPYLVTGQWQFPDGIGDLQITPDDCANVVKHFKANVRGQDLPIINEEHHPERAVGWVKDLVLAGEDRVDAVVEWNTTGEQLVANDEYRYLSPELFRDYTDAATGEHYPIVALGLDVRHRDAGHTSALAMTNKPRIKTLGPIRCSENDVEGVQAVALATTAPGAMIVTDDPLKAARALMAEDEDTSDDPNDDDGADSPCALQPGKWNGFRGQCPGFTNNPGDTDGDGSCKFASMGCNGYRAIDTDDADRFMFYAEGATGMANKPTPPASGEGAATTPTATEPVTTSAAATAGDELHIANMAEAETIIRTERSGRLELAERVKGLEDEIKRRDAKDKMDRATLRLSEARRKGQITPAEFEKLTADAKQLVRLAEDDFYLDAIEARPAVVNFSERGHGNEPAVETQSDDNSHLVRAAEQYIEEQGKAGKPVNMLDALKHVAATAGGATTGGK